jgi:hypothetical protein
MSEQEYTVKLDKFDLEVNDTKVSIDPAKWGKDAGRMIDGLVDVGLKTLLGRAAQAVEGKDKKIKAVQDRAAELNKPNYRFGQRGRVGPQLDATERGWLEFFAAIGHKENGKPVSGKTLERAQLTLCRENILANTEPGDVQKAVANMAELLKERLEPWKAAQESDMETVGGFIAIEQMKEKLTQKVNT